MSRLKANVDDLQEACELLKVNVGELELLKEELQEIINMMNTEWEGVSAEAYKNLLNAYMKEIEGIKEAVIGLKEYAAYVGVQMKVLDEILNIINSLFLIPIF